MRIIAILFFVLLLGACQTSIKNDKDLYESLSKKLAFSPEVTVDNRKGSEAVIVFHGILFDTGKYDLKDESIDTVIRVSAILKEEASLKYLYIEGHTDSVGRDSSNQILSDKRANRIKKAILSAGFDPDRIDVKGLGESYPKCENSTKIGRACNRRVEIVILKVQPAA